MVKAVLDTNVLVAALRSSRGTSFRLLSLVGRGKFEITLSVALTLEYEDALLRHQQDGLFDEADIRELLDYLCTVARRQKIFYLWRPVLRDPGDDMVLELAVASGSQCIITFNERHFEGCEAFGIRTLTPRTFLEEIGE